MRYLFLLVLLALLTAVGCKRGADTTAGPEPAEGARRGSPPPSSAP